jgi:hypothetical protein
VRVVAIVAMRFRFCISLFVMLALPALASAQPRVRHDADEREIDARLAFLEERIDRQHTHAQIWWGSFLTVYTGGAVVQAARASIEEDRATEVDLWISSAKATLGAMRYLTNPYGGIEDLDPAPATPLTRAGKLARVRHGERILEHNAEAQAKNRAWYVHASNLGINLVGGMIVAVGFDDPQTGFVSAGIGAVVGEIAIFTSPWEPEGDLAEYRRGFGRGRVKAGSRRPNHAEVVVRPTGSGGMLVVHY